MARIYLRLKHFVAAYVRKRYGAGVADLSAGVTLRAGSDAANVLQLMQQNVADKIVPGCFCERQWQRMLRGEHIDPQADDFMTAVRDPNDYLTEREVCELAGIEPLRGEEMGEYVAINIPQEARNREGDIMRTNGQWQLMHDAASELAHLLSEEFDEALYDYICNCLRDAKSRKTERALQDALEGFMLHYNIRNCADDREKKTLKRRYYRFIDGLRTDEPDDDIEFSSGRDRHVELVTRCNQAKTVLCADDDKRYPSILAASRAYGLGYDAMKKALKRDTRCGNRKFILVD